MATADHAQLANLAAMARSIFHQVGATEVAQPELTTLVSFDFTNGANPAAGLIADAQGDLFGTTYVGGANDHGTVFEITKTPHGYASTPITLVSFNGTDGTAPGALLADAHGDLFGTTQSGGANDFGTVFEICREFSRHENACQLHRLLPNCQSNPVRLAAAALYRPCSERIGDDIAASLGWGTNS
jgi:uncharacterized repeat protein (TIGR03803 family)